MLGSTPGGLRQGPEFDEHHDVPRRRGSSYSFFFRIAPDDGDGQAMFLFVGFKRKRAADEMQHRNAVDGITGDEFALAILSDQPDRHRGWKTWTLCDFTVAERTFQIGSHVGLAKTDTLTMSECVSFELAKRLRNRAKYWLAFYLVYDDLEDNLRVMKAC